MRQTTAEYQDERGRTNPAQVVTEAQLMKQSIRANQFLRIGYAPEVNVAELTGDMSRKSQ